MNDFGFLITAYQQTDLVEQNIQMIRHGYATLNDCHLVIVSTSEIDCGMKALEYRYPNVEVVEFKDAPGSSTCTWFERRPNPEVPYWSWRHEFLPARILYSMQIGIKRLYSKGIKKMLHLHSDSFWSCEYEQNLVNDINLLDRYIAIADLSLHEEDHAQCHRLVPEGLHWLPEGIMLHLEKCKAIDFGFGFNHIFDGQTDFYPTNFGMLERLTGSYFHYCLTGKNITTYEDHIDQTYFDSVYFRCKRTYHGDFGPIYGLVNLPGIQLDGK
jgi:hypothetical protein